MSGVFKELIAKPAIEPVFYFKPVWFDANKIKVGHSYEMSIFGWLQTQKGGKNRETV
jgi:hypothetical protein